MGLEEDAELGDPRFGVDGSVDTPVVPEEKVRVDEKLGRGGDKWDADPSSADTSEGVNAPKIPGRLKAHEPYALEEWPAGVVSMESYCGCVGATEPSLTARPWRPMEDGGRCKGEWRRRLGEESWGEGEAGREEVKEKRKARRDGGFRRRYV